MSSRSVVCRELSSELSALLDGELTAAQERAIRAHLKQCRQCAGELEALARVRRSLRTTTAEDIPDLVEPILARIPQEDVKERRRRERRIRLRTALTAAAVTTAVLIGAWLPGDDEPPQAALASEVVDDLRAEAQGLATYRATFSIVERGWHEDVSLRRFSAEVAYRAPQSFSLSLRDHTDYPAGKWAPNDVDLVANPRAWWIDEPSSCPPSSLPGCLDAGVGQEERALVKRAPFDGTIGLPTDLVLPLQTLAASEDFEVGVGDSIQGRATLHIELPFRQALPLVASLQTGGSWRSFYPSDPVDLWIDRSTGFPLRFSVTADESPERRAWARAQGLRDDAREPLLEVEATDFSEPRRFAPHTFDAPRRGTVSTAGFEGSPFGRFADRMAPRQTFGLDPFRAGSGPGGTKILSYVEGMAWLRVTHDAASSGVADPIAEEIALGGGRWAYYRPATFRQGKSIEMLDGTKSVLVETNLPREILLDIAASIDFGADRSPRRATRGRTFDVRRMDFSDLSDIDFVETPSFLPAGYAPATAYRSRVGRSVSVRAYYRSAEAEYDGLGIRVTQSTGVHLLPPSPEDAIEMRLDGKIVRWFPRRGEVDWIEDNVYTSISAPSLPRSSILQIVESLG